MRLSVPMGIRLAVAGGREGAARLALTTVGVAMGVTLILLTLTALPALQGREQREAWHRTSAASAPSASDPALWLAGYDHYLGRDLFRVSVAALGTRPPVPPGLERLPAPGDVAVSPALADLLAAAPADALAARLPGQVTAVISPDGLAYPGELVAVVGRTPDQLRALGAAQITGIETRAGTAIVNGALKVIVTIGAIGLLVPVVVFIATVTRVAAARREQRFAALRLAGATRAQIGLMAAAETAIAAVAGAGLGWLGYLATRPVVASRVTFDGAQFVTADVVAPGPQVLIVLIGVPLLAAATTIAGLYRVQVTPLGVSRRARTKAPAMWRLIPVVVGVAGLVTAATTDITDTSKSSVAGAQILIGVTFGSLLLGLVLAGPLVCAFAARLMSRLSRRAPTLMAARRIASDPYATFRAISGVVVAAFVTTMFAGSATGIQANLDHSAPAALRPAAVEIFTNALPGTLVDPLAAHLASTAGVRQVVTARHRPDAPNTLSVSCADLAAAINITCTAAPTLAGRTPRGLAGVSSLREPDPSLPVRALYVVTDGSPFADERVRSVAGAALPGTVISTGRDLAELDRRQLGELENGLRLAMLFVVFVATASLTVGVVAGLMQRRRPFALLRAAGVYLSELRSVIMLETMLPLAATTAIGVALGLATSAAVSSSTGERWAGPDLGFFVTVLIGLLTTVAVSAMALPLVRTMTEHDAVRFD